MAVLTLHPDAEKLTEALMSKLPFQIPNHSLSHSPAPPRYGLTRFQVHLADKPVFD